ncbi:hypothetical protein MMC25_004864 [Agyrium rufum]|nr:hypothetical protein [Agyrium rufum]
MPSPSLSPAKPDIKAIRLTNCRLFLPHSASVLVPQDLWISPTTGKILNPQRAFFDANITPSETYDLGGRIVAPGFIDVQLNGAYGFDFSVPSEDYGERLKGVVNRRLVGTGVTSYCPTLTSQREEVYAKTLPFLSAPHSRNASDGSESLGAHCEGPFINPERRGIHKCELLQIPTGFDKLEACYGAEHLAPSSTSISSTSSSSTIAPTIAMVTLAPELDRSQTIIRELHRRGIVASIGHTAASTTEAQEAVQQGASMITHLFNAMNQPHHRTPGVFGMLGSNNSSGGGDELVASNEKKKKPFFGLIADDIHVHPAMVWIAFAAHREGCILVTDAMSVLGLEDGEYKWTNGEIIVKEGGRVTLKGTEGTIAGSCVTLIECLNNMVRNTKVIAPVLLRCITENPARMLGIADRKGVLAPGADADLVVLSEYDVPVGPPNLKVEEVWKFGVRVFPSGTETEETKKEKEKQGVVEQSGENDMEGRPVRSFL